MNVLRKVGDYYGVARYLARHLCPEGTSKPRERTYAVNFSKWKRPLLEKMFPDRKFYYIPNLFRDGFFRRLHRWLGARSIFIWGMHCGDDVDKLIRDTGMDVLRFEDGFIRSVGLGSQHVPPLSWCLDTKAMHYNSRRPTRLDEILANHDFENDHDLMQEARECIELLRLHSISKYNLPFGPLDEARFAKDKKRVLCLGQVEDDQSIEFGANRTIRNTDLVRLAAQENPDAEVIFKVHPDYLAGKRKPLSNIDEVADLCTIIGNETPLHSLFGRVQRVFTITSLAGFEALMHSVPVTALGMPFYAGWGLTDDRQKVPEWRGRQLSFEQVFAGSYILYPVYLTPGTMEPCTLRETIKRIREQLAKQRSTEKSQSMAGTSP